METSTPPLLTEDDLLHGDILLFYGDPQKIISKKISEATDSPYTHAAICVGNGEIAESVIPRGVRKIQVLEALDGKNCAAVLRTQLVFDDVRAQNLDCFVDAVMDNRKLYDFKNVFDFETRSEKYFSSQIEFIQNHYGEISSSDELEKANYFCSSFVVACWIAAGVIGYSAQAAYPPENFSPAGLSRDPTFGWFLGYLVPEHGKIPDNDPLLIKSTKWLDNKASRWWK